MDSNSRVHEELQINGDEDERDWRGQNGTAAFGAAPEMLEYLLPLMLMT